MNDQEARGLLRLGRRAPIPAFAEMARALVREMAARGIDMVYGGGRLGLMGIIADEMLAAGGKVYGVIPQALVDHEVAHTGLHRAPHRRQHA